jgi:hypothetical protein
MAILNNILYVFFFFFLPHSSPVAVSFINMFVLAPTAKHENGPSGGALCGDIGVPQPGTGATPPLTLSNDLCLGPNGPR